MNLRTDPAALAAFDLAHRRARRVVIWHFIFFLGCCIVALLARRFLRFPPQLTWVLFAVFLVVFSGDFARLIYLNIQRRRLIRALSINS